MTEKHDDGLETHTRALFDASVESLDSRTRSKLTQARHAALAEMRPAQRRWMQTWIPLTGVTAVAILAVWLGLGQSGAIKPSSEAGELPLDDFDIVAENANLELLEEVEFYAWIAAQPVSSHGEHSG